MQRISTKLLVGLRNALTTLLFALPGHICFGQSLTGTFTVGLGGNYTTLGAAVADVTSKGVSGPVIFRLKTGTFTEQVTIGPVTGTSATNTITFESESGNAQDVILSFEPTSSQNYVIRLENASYLVFRNFSIETSGGNYTRGIYGVSNLNTITFEGLRIMLPATTSANEDRGAIILRPSLSANIRFINNRITGGAYGILHIGNSTSRSPGTVFTGNEITGVYYRPAYLEYLNGLVFNDNTITASSAHSDYRGARIENVSGYMEMLRNRITGAVGYALYLANCIGTDVQPSIIANNFFHSNSSQTTVYFYYRFAYINFYHNSVHNTSTGDAFYFYRGESTGNRIVNNIFKANSGYALNYNSTSQEAIVESDYNNLFTSGSFIVRDGSTDYGTLPAWQAASGTEAHSVSYDPQFQSGAELYASAPGLASAGKNLLSEVGSDIDGVSRTSAPSIGATQYSAAALTPLSGTYTIGTGGGFDFASINAAIDAMKVNGINGPVTFRLNSETFSERFVLPAISGMSSSNPIVFESQSGNAEDVVLAPPAAANSAENYIAWLTNAAYVTFRNMTFQSQGGTNFNRAIYVNNRADDLTFEGLVIALPATTSATEDRGAIIARPSLSSNIRFINNRITGGAYGILHIGKSTSYSPGTVFTGNEITDVYYRPAYLEYLNGLVFNDNIITASSAHSDYRGANIENISGYMEMLRNRITGAVGYAAYLSYCLGTDVQPSIIANNFFHSNSSRTTVYFYYQFAHINFYHNSVHNTSTGDAFYFYRGQSTGNRIVNNIFKASTGYALNYNAASQEAIVELDYNNLFTSGSFIVRDGSTDYGTLSAWQAASGTEAHSVSYDPQFQSGAELYASAPGLASAGKNLMSEVPSDIDGVSRTPTPSIGATQYSADALTPLSGTYTIGTGGGFDFASINAAIDAMKANGINGPVTFRLNSETFSERFVLPAISGMSSSNPIVFESQSGNAEDVVLSAPAAASTAENYIAWLSNAAYVTFRNMTFQPQDGTNFNRAIYVNNRADDLTFEGLVITLPVTSSTAEDRAATIVRPSLSSNIRFINNRITGGAYGILYIGKSTSHSPGTVFTGNVITNVYSRPAYLEYLNGLVFNDNIITASSAHSDYRGAHIENISGYMEMLRNRVTGAVGYAAYLSYCLGTDLQPSIIANNFFHSNSSRTTVYFYYQFAHINFYHNSVHNTSTGDAFYFYRGQSTGNRIVNNIFKASTGYALNYNSASQEAIVESDYNNFFTSGSFIVRDGSTDYGTLPAWQTASGTEAHSVSYDPQFQSGAELYASAPGIASAGKNLMTEVPSDIDGVSRTPTPSIGATQYSADALTPLSGTYTIGTGGGFDFASINAAIDAMKVNGINGPVTFKLNSQTFSERFVLPAISGMSSSNPIVFESQSGNAEDVVLSAPAAANTGENYIAWLTNAAYVTFRNMTFQPEGGTNFNRAIYVNNRADDLTFEGLVITLPVTSSTAEDRGAIIARPTLSSNIRFINNRITGGAYGILHIGKNTSRSPGTVFTGNEITDVYSRPAYLEYLDGLVFNDNIITASSAHSGYRGANIENISGYMEMLRNRITGAVGYAAYLSSCLGTDVQPSIIANNFFHSNSSQTTVYFYYQFAHINFYHNSVHNTSTGDALYFYRGQSTGNRFVNNIFKANTGYAINYNTTSDDAIVESDYNNLFTSGSFIVRDGPTDHGTLSSWQTASGFEANSVSIDPQFQSSTELYTSVGALSGIGKNVNTEVPDDIDGVARPSAPSLGAAQFGASGSPLSGTYTISSSGSGETNFTSITSALDALKNSGINGPVVFKVNGEFNEQLTFLAVPGSSQTNTVTFESESGNPNDAVIRYSSTSAGANFTIKLSNADHYRFRNLSIVADNADFARAVHAVNRTIDIVFENNIIKSVVTTATNSQRAGILIESAQSQDVRILNNVITDGAYGILFTGPSNKSTGTIIRGNVVERAFYRGIDLAYHSGVIVDKNEVLNNPSSTNFTGIEVSTVDGPFQITANKVIGGNGTALSVTSGLATAGSAALIANNFLHTSNVSTRQAMYLNYLRNVDIYHNNVNATGSGNSLYYTSSSGQNLNIANNIFKATGVAVYIVHPAAIGQIDYNDYYTTGPTLGNWGSSPATDLAAWQALTGQDENSFSVDPEYQSETDLEALASSLAGAGLDLTAIVPTDINGNTRSLPVSIGASQFSAAFSIDGAVSRIVAPVSDCSLTAFEQVTVEIINLGASLISGFQVGYQLNGGTPVVEDIPAAVTLAPGAKYRYTFAQTVDLTAKATYTLSASIILSGDENPENDNLQSTIVHHPDMNTTVTGNTTICKGESITLTATGGAQYVWNTGANAANLTVTPSVTTTYSVVIANGNNCRDTLETTVSVRESPLIEYSGQPGFTNSYVSPLQGGSDIPFEFRMRYTDANGNSPESGYPRVELDANGNGEPTDPFDIIKSMEEVDPADTDVTDGKEYRASITGLSDNISWRSRIVALSADGCPAKTPFVLSPVVSNDLLDVGIYANDISFTKSNPALNETVRIYARIRNTSDYIAENFVVSAYIDEEQVFTQIISQLNPQSHITLQWDQSFAISGFYPVKVVVDETNVLDEDNELNNFAIRPLLVGDYELPGGIEVDVPTDPFELQPRQTISISGTAQYFGIDPDVDPDVAGATVIARIGDAVRAQTTTRPDGTFSVSFSAPSSPGTYSLVVEVTDYTLTGYSEPITITILPEPPKPDLTVAISLDRNTIIAGEQVSGIVMLQNVGEIAATEFLFRYFNCDAVLGEEQIESLAPGESRTYTFTTTTSVIGDCFNRNNCGFRAVADVNNQVQEKTEANNQSNVYLTILPNKPDLTVVNVTNGVIPGSVNMLNPFSFNVRVDNIGGVGVTAPFTVNVYMDDELIRTEEVPALNTCAGIVFAVTHDFGGDTGDKVLTIKVDEPIGSGIIDEYRETNNEFSKTIRHVPPPPKHPNLNTSVYDISVAPALPMAGDEFEIQVVYRNNGQADLTAPFNIEMTVTENGIPRIETVPVNETILQGATRSVTVNTSLATDGNHSFLVRLDSDNSVTEASEGDNAAQVPLCVDLTVTGIGQVWNSFYVNTLQNLTARVQNLGMFTPDDVSVSFYVNDVKVGSTTLPVVQPALRAAYYDVSVPYLFDETGSFELKVVVDDDAEFTECREDNNEYKRTITVLAPKPDVRVFSEYIAPSKINPDVDEEITIFLSYDNIGIGDSGPFKARILVDDVPVGPDVDIPSVAAGDDGTVEVPTPYKSSTAGIRVIRAVLDPENELNETTKVNNEATRALVVGDAPNLFFTNLHTNVECPDDGSRVLITASITNGGDLETTAELVFYYVTESDTIPIDTKQFTLTGNASADIETEWYVLNKLFNLYAEIRYADPAEYDESDNSIFTKLCGGPYYNLLVEAKGQGIVRKTPNMGRYEGVQEVTVTAMPATGWVFAGWEGDVSGTNNPLTFDLSADRIVVAVFNEAFATPVAGDVSRCGPGSVTLEASGAIGSQNYVWYTEATGGNPLPGEQNATFTTPDLQSTTSYYVAVASSNGEGPRTEVRAVILPLPQQPEVSVEGSLNCPDEDSPTLLHAPAGFESYVWSSGETTSTIEVTAVGSYSVTVTDEFGCVSAPSQDVVFTAEACDEIIVYNAISPGNGDNFNERLIIENIDRIPDARDNTLRIFNRWGDVVFEVKGYDNVTKPFIGLTDDGRKLSSGTYFYVLEFKSGRPKMSGYIVIRN